MWIIIATRIHISYLQKEAIMRIIQMTLDDDLVRAVDKIAKQLKTTRSAFARSALREAIRKFDLKQLEKKHRRGYELHPVNRQEFSVWEAEQDWGDE
jgi:metal-responsive CopG/Arc/MetJ family transcriptional regulator